MTLGLLGAWINGPGKKLPVLKDGGYLHQCTETIEQEACKPGEGVSYMYI